MKRAMQVFSLACKQGNHKGCSVEGCACPCHWPPRKKARDRADERTPWNNMKSELRLYVSPRLKAQFDLPCQVWAYGEEPPL